MQQREHKLAPVWEGPFLVSKVLHNGSYYLIDIREEKDRPKNQKRKRENRIISILNPPDHGT